MLRALSPVIADCYRRASDARQWADQANDPDTRAFWLRAEDRWLKLAKHHGAAERLAAFIGDNSPPESYHLHELRPGSWEWVVYGSRARILSRGTAKSMVDARVAAMRFVIDFTENQSPREKQLQ